MIKIYHPCDQFYLLGHCYCGCCWTKKIAHMRWKVICHYTDIWGMKSGMSLYRHLRNEKWYVVIQTFEEWNAIWMFHWCSIDILIALNKISFVHRKFIWQCIMMFLTFHVKCQFIWSYTFVAFSFILPIIDWLTTASIFGKKSQI